MASSKLSMRSWKRALSAPERLRATREKPIWLQRFLTAYANASPAANETRGLLNALIPFAAPSRKRLRAAISQSEVAPRDPKAIEGLISSLEASLFERLFDATSQTLVLELGVAAQRKLLGGRTRQARFNFFCECLADPDFSSRLLAQYPSLVRRLDSVIVNWETAALELLLRLAADIAVVQSALLSRSHTGALVRVTELGDPHSGGRTVSRLLFESGQAVIYKPRSVAMEYGYRFLVTEMNDRGLSPDLRAAEVLDRDIYGWVSNIDPAPCSNAEGVRRFFHREGQILALMYVLGATDLHYENVIAAGEYPVVVDLETLFQSIPPASGMSKGGTTAFNVVADSVTRTLLLPTRIASPAQPAADASSVDISALGYTAGKRSPFPSHEWENRDTDAMHMRDRHALMPLADCLPELDGRRVGASSHLDEIVAGFSDAYDHLARWKAELRAPRGALAIFKGRRHRHVFRATAEYAQLLARSWHPRLGYDRERLARDLRDRLGVFDPSRKSKRAMMRAELSDLTAGDIPYFRAKVSERAASSPTRPNVDIRLAADGWRACLRRVSGLSPSDKARQIWLTRLAFVDLNVPLKAPRARNRTPVTAKRILEAASRIGDRLCELAICTEDHASWLFPLVEDQNYLVPAVVGFDVYQGLAGIGFFLGYLSQSSRDRRHRGMAVAAVAEALSLYRRVRYADKPAGAFEGAAGLAYVLAHLGPLLGRPKWSSEAINIIRAEVVRAKDSLGVDVISGRAGLLLAGVAVAQVTRDSALLTALRPIAEALRTLRGSSLPSNGEAGLAHGKAGIALALGRWATATGDQAARTRSMALLKQDLAAARSSRRRAPGSRELDEGPAMIAWCRGALGMVLATVQLGHPVGRVGKTIFQDACNELNSSRASAALCLCHGSLGILECLDGIRNSAGIVSGRQLSTLRRRHLNRVLGGEYCADHAHRLDAPGLMLGMAGTGYALLRMLDPQTIPSVLILETNEKARGGADYRHP